MKSLENVDVFDPIANEITRKYRSSSLLYGCIGENDEHHTFYQLKIEYYQYTILAIKL